MNPETYRLQYCHVHQDREAMEQCRICNAACCEECLHKGTGICKECLFKGAVIVVILMIIISYTAWLGLLIY